MKENKISYYKIFEEKANDKKMESDLDTDIQVAYLNMLHDMGLLPDKVHMLAVEKAMKGVV